MRLQTVLALLAVCPLAVACATSSNPSRPETSRWREQGAVTDERAADAAVGTEQSEPAADAPESAAAPAATAPSAAEPSDDPRVVVARVGDRTIDVSALLAAWMHANSREVSDLLERLVTALTVDIEADRIGLTLEPEQIEKGYQELVAEMEQDLHKNRPEMDLDTWVRTVLGLDPESYRRGLRKDVARKLAGERLVRTFVLTNERANVRVIVTANREDMQVVQDALAAGRPFEELAREKSVDPSASKGGVLPPVLRTPASLSRLAFLTEVGSIGGPIQDTEGGRWLSLEVRSIDAPLAGNWKELGPTVEASLAERPLEDAEYMQWMAQMTRSYEVDLEPFFRLVDGASP